MTRGLGCWGAGQALGARGARRRGCVGAQARGAGERWGEQATGAQRRWGARDANGRRAARA